MSQRQFFNENERLVSTTDPSSIIQHANQVFCDVAGYRQEELVGKPHNLIRHPDMPKAAFKSLWDTIQAGKPWMGMVKNRCKNGDYYWVDAFVSPVMQNGEIIAYQSVRSAPAQEHVDSAEELYAAINDKRSTGFEVPLSFSGKVLGLYAIAMVIIATGLLVGGPIGIGVAAIGAIGGGLGLHRLFGFWRRLVADCRAVHDDPLACRVYTGRTDDLGSVALAVKFLKSEMTTILTRTADSADNLDALAERTFSSCKKTEEAITTQQEEILSISAAINQMSTAIQEVSRSTSETSNATGSASENAAHGSEVSKRSVSETQLLNDNFTGVTETLHRLGEDSVAIGTVMNVINSIAEQTNVLALNATIEAARAGEQGRGFAVVADEVRLLAQQTQQSTTEIRAIVDRLQSSATESIEAMDAARDKVAECLGFNKDAGEAYARINSAIATIKDMTIAVAAAVEQQSAVTDETNRNISSIQAGSEKVVEVFNDTQEVAHSLADSIDKTKEMIQQFGAGK